MAKEKRDFPKSPTENSPDETGSIEVKFGGATASLLEHLLFTSSGKIRGHDWDSIAVAWTAGALQDPDTFQRGRNDAGVRAFVPTYVCHASVDWSHDFPGPCAAGESHDIILMNSRYHGSFSVVVDHTYSPDAALRRREGDVGEKRVFRRGGHGIGVVFDQGPRWRADTGLGSDGAQESVLVGGNKWKQRPYCESQ